jgi:hypothetical protein
MTASRHCITTIRPTPRRRSFQTPDCNGSTGRSLHQPREVGGRHESDRGIHREPESVSSHPPAAVTATVADGGSYHGSPSRLVLSLKAHRPLTSAPPVYRQLKRSFRPISDGGLARAYWPTGEENDTHTQAMAFTHMLMWIGQAKVGPVRCSRHLSHIHVRRLPRPQDGWLPARRAHRPCILDR